MIRDVIDDLFGVGGVEGVFRALSRCEMVGGEDDKPLAAFETWTGSRLGESLPRLLGLCWERN